MSERKPNAADEGSEICVRRLREEAHHAASCVQELSKHNELLLCFPYILEKLRTVQYEEKGIKEQLEHQSMIIQKLQEDFENLKASTYEFRTKVDLTTK